MLHMYTICHMCKRFVTCIHCIMCVHCMSHKYTACHICVHCLSRFHCLSHVYTLCHMCTQPVIHVHCLSHVYTLPVMCVHCLSHVYTACHVCLFQDMVAEMCTEYFQRYRRQTHVTPKSYLSFIAGYKAIYGTKRQAIGILAERMDTGQWVCVEDGRTNCSGRVDGL